MSMFATEFKKKILIVYVCVRGRKRENAEGETEKTVWKKINW